MREFLFLCFVSIAFIFLGVAGVIAGKSTWKEVIQDLRFLWGPGSDGDVYYGITFESE